MVYLNLVTFKVQIYFVKIWHLKIGQKIQMEEMEIKIKARRKEGKKEKKKERERKWEEEGKAKEKYKKLKEKENKYKTKCFVNEKRIKNPHIQHIFSNVSAH